MKKILVLFVLLAFASLDSNAQFTFEVSGFHKPENPFPKKTIPEGYYKAKPHCLIYGGSDITKMTWSGGSKKGYAEGYGTSNIYKGNTLFATYIGDIKSGKFDGQGSITWATGIKYTGEFSNGYMQGKGTYILTNGEKYEGYFKNNTFNGNGTYTYEDGHSVTGYFENGKTPHNYGTFTDSRDGKVYKTINIGTQIWMAENLAYKPENGYWSYNNNQSYVQGANYGYLYNKNASQNVCPIGWHLPSDAEWKKLSDYLGGANFAGGKLKFMTGWNDPNTSATNESGFSGLPSGQHTFNFNMFTGSNTDVFSLAGESGCWWSKSWNEPWGSGWQNVIAAWRLNYNSSSFTRESYFMDLNCPYDFSVRCVKD